MKKLVVLLAVLSLMACSKNEDHPSGSSSVDNESHELVTKPELTKDQNAEIKEITSKASLMPKTSLLLAPESESESEKTERQARIEKLGSESKQIFDKLKDSCELGAPKKTVTGDQKKVGSKEVVKTLASIDGAKCPIQYKESSTDESVVIETNLDSIQGKNDTLKQKSKSSATESTSLKVIGQDLQGQVGFKEVTTESTRSDLFQVNGKNGDLTSKNLSHSTIVTAQDKKIKFRQLIEFMNQGDKFDYYSRLDMDFPSSSPTIQIIKKTDDKEQTIYLNGKKITTEQLQEIFGPDIVNIQVTLPTKVSAKKAIQAKAKTGS
jgi:hypothetical protein